MCFYFPLSLLRFSNNNSYKTYTKLYFLIITSLFQRHTGILRQNLPKTRKEITPTKLKTSHCYVIRRLHEKRQSTWRVRTGRLEMRK